MELAAETMMELWKAAMRHILMNGRRFVDDDGKRCREIQNLVVTIKKPSSSIDGVRAMRVVRKWRYPSEEELANIMLNKEAGGIYDYLYGQRIFAYNGTLNQIDEYVVPSLQQRPETRRAIVSLLNPLRDLKMGKKNIIGMSLLQFRIIEKRLVVTAIIRTSGFFTGWPANVFQVAKLQAHVARQLQIPAGPLTTISLAAHIHDENLEDIELVLGKDVVKDAKE